MLSTKDKTCALCAVRRDPAIRIMKVILTTARGQTTGHWVCGACLLELDDRQPRYPYAGPCIECKKGVGGMSVMKDPDIFCSYDCAMAYARSCCDEADIISAIVPDETDALIED